MKIKLRLINQNIIYSINIMCVKIPGKPIPNGDSKASIDETGKNQKILTSKSIQSENIFIIQ